MSKRSSSVKDEPNFQPILSKNRVDENEVWSEPVLLPDAKPKGGVETHADQIRKAWRSASVVCSWKVTALLMGVAAPLGVFASVVRSGSFSALVVLVILAPLVEELGKVLAPLMVLELHPYRFTSGMQPLLVCVVSGLVFALIENQFYYRLYIRNPSLELMEWRGSVCILLHVGCSLISGMGLRRVWQSARAREAKSDLSAASIYFLVAMVIHGLYNALAYGAQVARIVSFD
ncbi:MAG: PrsW family glutamic-type intramembrane protease [Kiritimatiellia bacterium]|nr:PrsW family glutamic-type intramembrane protease [Kiritimatiellia bacterium]